MNNRMSYIALLLIAPMNVITCTVLFAAIPMIAKHFSTVNNIQLLSQLILTLPFLAIALFSPFVHHITYRFGEKRTFVVTLIYLAFLGTLTGTFDNIYFILIARLFFGFGIAIVSSLFLSFIGKLFQNTQRNDFLGYQRSFMFLAGVVFTLLGGVASEYSWRYSFYLYLLIIVIVLTSIYFIHLPKTPPIKSKQSNLYIAFQYKAFYFLVFLLNLLFYLVPTQMPFLLDTLGHSSYISIILGFHFFAAVFSAFIFGYLSKIISLKAIFINTLCLKALAFIIFSYTVSIPVFVISCLISGLSSGLLHVLLARWLLDELSTAYYIQGSSFLSATMYLGFFFSPIIAHPLIQYSSIQAIFLCGGLIFMLISIYIYKRF